MDKTDKCVIVYGNLSDGFTFVGPFDSFDDADEYTQGTSTGFWIATLEQPDVVED